MDFKPPGNLD
jgi:hypothetical protein